MAKELKAYTLNVTLPIVLPFGALLTPEYRSYVGEDLGMHPYYPITHVIATYVIGFISPAFLYSGLKLVHSYRTNYTPD